MKKPKNYLTLTRLGNELVLKAFSSGVFLGSLKVRSGYGSSANKFRTRANERPGLNEPVPEGHYPLGALEWAGGKGDYITNYPRIDSPIWVEVIGWPRWIGFHLDAGVEGTAGCIGFKTMADLKTFVNWVNGYGHFSDLFVDWGLGSVDLPREGPDLKVEHTARASFRGREISINLQNGNTVLTAQDLRDLGIGVEWDAPNRTSRLTL